MQLEESENLKFDIEILTEEKAMIETELNQARSSNKDLEKQIQELRSQINEKAKIEEEVKA